MYLVLSALTSSPISLVAATNASALETRTKRRKREKQLRATMYTIPTVFTHVLLMTIPCRQ